MPYIREKYAEEIFDITPDAVRDSIFNDIRICIENVLREYANVGGREYGLACANSEDIEKKI